jgi:hypothetical protein
MTILQNSIHMNTLNQLAKKCYIEFGGRVNKRTESQSVQLPVRTCLEYAKEVE